MSGKKAYKDYVIELDRDTFQSYMQKHSNYNVFVMFYSPIFEHSHYAVSPFYRNAYAFHVLFALLFDRSPITASCSRATTVRKA